MRDLYQRILSRLNISGRDITVFLLALLLAFSTWLIHNLSLKYNAYMSVTIRAVCNIDGHSQLSSNKCNVVARCRATGYNVLKNSYLSADKVKDVKFESSSMSRKGDDTFYITAGELKEYTHLIFGNGVTVEYFSSDTLNFSFPVENSRKVPVQPVSFIRYDNQYTGLQPIRIYPDSITVYGNPSNISDIKCVYTEHIKHNRVRNDIQGSVALEEIKGVRFSEESVDYSLNVSRYVEVKSSMPVNVRNLPNDKSIMIFPSKVEVSMKCVFPMSGDPFSGCTVSVDYNELLKSLSGKCHVTIDNSPKGLISYDVHPHVVRCLVEDL